MPKFAQFVIGPAGCGKSTYCSIVQEHFRVSLRRTARVINLDPAAESFSYDCEIDVRELISVDDVMEELDYGPNGGLVYAMEYIVDNSEWLTDQLEEYCNDDYFLFDCPGQIELYSHLPVMRQLVDTLQNIDFRLCGVYCIDIMFLEESSKALSGALAALTAMVNLELPHINMLTKCDLLREDRDVEAFLDGDAQAVARELHQEMRPQHRALNQAIANLLEEYSLVSFVAINRDDEDSVDLAISQVHNAIQYGEDLEPREPKEPIERDDDDDYDDGDMEEMD